MGEGRGFSLQAYGVVEFVAAKTQCVVPREVYQKLRAN
jgi:hypothetical protein